MKKLTLQQKRSLDTLKRAMCYAKHSGLISKMLKGSIRSWNNVSNQVDSMMKEYGIDYLDERIWN